MKTLQDAEILKELEYIAIKNIPGLEGRQDLDPKNSDSEDFFEISVWSLKDALLAAYEMGKNANSK